MSNITNMSEQMKRLKKTFVVLVKIQKEKKVS